MKSLVLCRDVAELLIEAATQRFNRERCGFLFGSVSSGVISVNDIAGVANSSYGAGRFSIAASEVQRVERLTKRASLEIVGVYHTHPDGGSDLSKSDLANLSVSILPWIIVGEGSVSDRCIAAYEPKSGRSVVVLVER